MNDIEQINRVYRKYVREPKDPEVGGEDIDLEVLLVNSLRINAEKVQEIVDSFLIEKEYISIFCLTETKVDCVDFVPVGLTTYDRQRTSKPGQKKSGGLMIGHITDERVKLEKIETESEDILIVEGEIYKERVKIILAYFNCGKLMAGRRYEENRKMQREIERHMVIEDGVNLIILGDMNARLTVLEPSIETDANGQMIEDWVGKMADTHSENQREERVL